jgi:hypothetical protein
MALQKGSLQSVILSVAASHLSAVLPYKDTNVVTDKYHRFALESLPSALANPVERLSDVMTCGFLMLFELTIVTASEIIIMFFTKN